MGCWNKTCGLTNLPIYSGDEIVWFLLVATPTLRARDSYASAQWEMIPVPVYGKYDDYGFMEPDDGQEWKLQLFQNHFANSLVKLNDETDDELDGATSPFVSFEVLNECLRNDSFGIKETSFTHAGQTKVTCIFGDFMVHAATFAELTAKHEGAWLEEVFTREQIEATLEKFHAFRKAEIAECEALLEANSNDMETRVRLHGLRHARMRDESLDAFVATLDTTSKYSHHYCGAPVVRFWYDDCGSSRGYITRAFIQTLSYYDTKDNPLSIKEQVDAALLSEIMSGLRKQFSPGGHEGSQDGMWSLHDQFAVSYKNRIAEYNSKYDDEE